MARVKKPYEEGDWFEIDLPDGRTIGIIARSSRRGVLGGFFFGPIASSTELPTLNALRKEQAALVCRFGDTGLVEGKWTVIDHSDPWDSKQWSLPEFVYFDPVDPLLAFARRYDDQNPNSLPLERRISIGEARSMAADGVFGQHAVEAWLGKLFRGERLPDLRAKVASGEEPPGTSRNRS